MQYFGVPRCPYCKKRVNLIRTWSLKRQGEYQCPRCGGISNIFLSPLVYVLALLAVFSGGAVYFFHKFVLDDIGASTCLQVFVPFAAFFLISLFLVYLEKPVIKRVSREEAGKKGKGRAQSGATGQVYVDEGEYLPNGYTTGSMPPVQSPAPRRVSSSAQPTAVMPQEGTGSLPRGTAQRRSVSQSTAVIPQTGTGSLPRTGAQRRPAPQAPGASQGAQRRPASQATTTMPAAGTGSLPRTGAPSPAAQRRQAAQRTAAQSSAAHRTQPQEERVQSRVAPVAEPQPQRTQRPAAQETPAWTTVQQQRPAPQREAPRVETPRQVRPASNPSLGTPRRASHVVSSVEIPDLTEDFFKKYDDPAYVERRLKELQQGENKD